MSPWAKMTAKRLNFFFTVSPMWRNVFIPGASHLFSQIQRNSSKSRMFFCFFLPGYNAMTPALAGEFLYSIYYPPSTDTKHAAHFFGILDF